MASIGLASLGAAAASSSWPVSAKLAARDASRLPTGPAPPATPAATAPPSSAPHDSRAPCLSVIPSLGSGNEGGLLLANASRQSATLYRRYASQQSMADRPLPTALAMLAHGETTSVGTPATRMGEGGPSARPASSACRAMPCTSWTRSSSGHGADAAAPAETPVVLVCEAGLPPDPLSC